MKTFLLMAALAMSLAACAMPIEIDESVAKASVAQRLDIPEEEIVYLRPVTATLVKDYALKKRTIGFGYHFGVYVQTKTEIGVFVAHEGAWHEAVRARLGNIRQVAIAKETTLIDRAKIAQLQIDFDNSLLLINVTN